MVIPSFGSPLVLVTDTPAILPWSAVPAFVATAPFSSFAPTELTAPERWLFFAVPYPMTTTCSRATLSSSILTLIGALDDIVCSILFIPIVENTSMSPLLALTVYLPSIFVTVPVSFPLTFTVTPGKGSLVVASVTTPLTSIFWATNGILARQRKKKSKKWIFLLMIYCIRFINS